MSEEITPLEYEGRQRNPRFRCATLIVFATVGAVAALVLEQFGVRQWVGYEVHEIGLWPTLVWFASLLTALASIAFGIAAFRRREGALTCLLLIPAILVVVYALWMSADAKVIYFE